MTRERLESLSDDVLTALAEEFEVDWSEDDGRQLLIDSLLEAYEDIRSERDAANNNLVRVQEKKYDIQEEIVSDHLLSTIELPNRYNESRVTLLLRDPAWAYCYWDINDYHMQKMSEQYEKPVTGLIIRVVELACCDDEGGTVIDSFDVPVSMDDRNWYINLPNRDTFYRVRLILQLEDNEVLISTSNTIQVPVGFLSSNGKDDANADALIAISGIENLGVSSFGASVPKRIRNYSDQYFLD
ncbi:DUF4912 domain-containing protein [Spirochaeta dissipatitropha]